MIQKLKAFWASLPHQKQALIVAFLMATGASLAHAFQDAGGLDCLTWPCLGHVVRSVFTPHMIFTAVFSGAAALKLFYMMPNRGVPAQGANPGQPAPPAV